MLNPKQNARPKRICWGFVDLESRDPEDPRRFLFFPLPPNQGGEDLGFRLVYRKSP